jgi:hypothetical protein
MFEVPQIVLAMRSDTARTTRSTTIEESRAMPNASHASAMRVEFFVDDAWEAAVAFSMASSRVGIPCSIPALLKNDVYQGKRCILLIKT